MQAALEEFVRHEHIPMSTVALTQFMHSLFEEKLASHKRHLMEGKQLADLIDLRPQSEPPGRESEPGPARPLSMLSTPPAAARTVTDINAATRKANGAVVAAIALAAALGASGFAYWQHRHDRVGNPQTAATPSPSRGSISVTSDPPGATFWIDGEMRPEITPATIAHLPTGRAIDVKVTKEGFEIAKQLVTLGDTKPSTTLTLTLPKGLVIVEVMVSPPGLNSTVLLDGQPAKTSPNGSSAERDSLRVDGVSAGRNHQLVVSAPGYVDQAMQFFGEPRERKRLDVVMQKDLGHHVAGAAPPKR